MKNYMHAQVMILLLHYDCKWKQGKEEKKNLQFIFIVASIGGRSTHEEL
jgi:hypothetical protein